MLVLYYIDFPSYQTIGWTTMCMISFSNNCALNTSTRIRPWTCNIKERTYLGTQELESLASLALGLLQLDGPQRRALQCSICVTHTCTDTRAHTHTHSEMAACKSAQIVGGKWGGRENTVRRKMKPDERWRRMSRRNIECRRWRKVNRKKNNR